MCRRVTPVALRAPSVTLLHTIIDALMHLKINNKWTWQTSPLQKNLFNANRVKGGLYSDEFLATAVNIFSGLFYRIPGIDKLRVG